MYSTKLSEISRKDKHIMLLPVFSSNTLWTICPRLHRKTGTEIVLIQERKSASAAASKTIPDTSTLTELTYITQCYLKRHNGHIP